MWIFPFRRVKSKLYETFSMNRDFSDKDKQEVCKQMFYIESYIEVEILLSYAEICDMQFGVDPCIT